MSATVLTRFAVGRRALLAAAVSLVGCGEAASAYSPSGPVDISVVDRETGQEIPVWTHRGRDYVAGRPGARYSLRVKNNTGGRVLVVMSVDGVNILTGETAGYDQRGYVFSPYETYDVNGWRKSDTEVAQFSFAALPNSYAARTGRPGNVGVIGVAVFNEKIDYPKPYYPQAEASRAAPSNEGRRAAPAAPAPAARAGAAADNEVDEVVTTGSFRSGALESPPVQAQRMEQPKLGTAHGAREWSYVQTVAFERASRSPNFTRQIEYDTYQRLAARGVIPTYRPRPEPRPRPFPQGPGYVPDPPSGY